MESLLDEDEYGEVFLKETFPATKEQEIGQIEFLQQMMAENKPINEENVSKNTFKPLDRPTTPTMMLMEEAGQVAQIQQVKERVLSAGWPRNDQPNVNSSGYIGNSRANVQGLTENGRLISATRRENSVVYNNQSIVIDALPDDKKVKVKPDDADFKRDRQQRVARRLHIEAANQPDAAER